MLKTKEQQLWLIVIVLFGVFVLFRCFSEPRAGRVYVVSTGSSVDKATDVDQQAGVARVSLSRSVGLWVGALLTIGIFSFLYGDNPYYKVCEAIFIGISAAYWMVLAFWTTIIPNLFGKLFPAWIQTWALPGLPTAHEGDWWLYFVPLILGVMLVMRLIPQYSWMARWPLAFVIGTTAGLRLIAFLEADFMTQIVSTVESFPTASALWAGWQATPRNYDPLWSLLDQVIIVVSILACLVYFFFSIEHKGAVAKVARMGVWVLMITFGAGFGFTVMGRIALLAIRIEFLTNDWLALSGG